MSRKKTTNCEWKNIFSRLLKSILRIYEIDYRRFSTEKMVSESAVRYWMIGRNLPQIPNLVDLKNFLLCINVDDPRKFQSLKDEAYSLFSENGQKETYIQLVTNNPTPYCFICELLSICFSFAKNEYPYYQRTLLPSTDQPIVTKAVVFDFDGTLTAGEFKRTTWEKLWIELGYDVTECKDLHKKYNEHEITHNEWCKLTEAKFCAKQLHREDVEKVAKRIRLLKGVKQTFIELQKRDIKIYIVSGSIGTVIDAVLRDLKRYVQATKSNQFAYDSVSGLLTEIIGTKYDFEGKAEFITDITNELKISPREILFVGNSINDRFAYRSQARTLCINPQYTDQTDRIIWHNYIELCKDLQQILSFV